MSDQTPTGQPPAGDEPRPSAPLPPSGQEPYGQEPYVPNPYAQNPYGQPEQQPPLYGQQPYGQAPYGQPEQQQPQYGQQPYGQVPYGQQPYGQPQFAQYPTGAFPFTTRDPDKRPGTVLAASLITIITSAISLLMFGLMTLLMSTSRDDMLSEIESNSSDFDSLDMTPDQLYSLFQGLFVVLLVWSIVGVVLGVWALRRSNLARILLVVSSSGVALLGLVLFGSVVSLLWTVAAVGVIVLLFVGGANVWYGKRPPVPQAYQPYQQL
ncbi:MAG: hypothetical protein U0R80_01925 [Nocardioidaceae bacterium]